MGLLMIGLLNCVIMAQKKSKIPFLFPLSVCSFIHLFRKLGAY